MKQPDCWLEWVKQNKSGKVPQKWIDYIAEREKPCEGCKHVDETDRCYRYYTRCNPPHWSHFK
jgi:hypothetical protein